MQTMGLELYHSDHSTCSQKVRICLAEKGLDWESYVLHFASGDHLTPEYLKLNPNGVVPTLIYGGEPVIESSMIVEYLDEIHPAPSLFPADALGRARLRIWMRYMEEMPTPAVRVPSFNKVFRPLRYENASQADFLPGSRRCRCARRSTGAWARSTGSPPTRWTTRSR
jgi:glutathione S-transferase